MENKLRELVKDGKTLSEETKDAVYEMLLAEKGKGIWILAPEKLALDQDNEVTVLGWDYYDSKPRQRRSIQKSGIAVVTRLESLETMAGLVAEPKDPAGPPRKPSTDPIADDDENLLTFKFGWREQIPTLPWRAGTYLVDVLLDGTPSNRLQVQITPGAAAERDPAVAEFIEQHKAKSAAPKEPFPASGDYKKNDKSLALPEGEGIQLSVERVSVYKPDAKLILRGSYRLTLPSAFYRAEKGGEGTANVPISLVIAGNDLDGPTVVPLRVPTYDAIDPESKETVVTGYFAIDLAGIKEVSKVAQTNFLYAYYGKVRSELATFALITPDMLK